MPMKVPPGCEPHGLATLALVESLDDLDDLPTRLLVSGERKPCWQKPC